MKNETYKEDVCDELNRVKYAIYKYDLDLGPLNVVEMPKNARILKIGMQYDQLKLWAIVNKEEPIIERRFCFFGTGMQLCENTLNNLIYIATLQENGGVYIWHVFEIKNKEAAMESNCKINSRQLKIIQEKLQSLKIDLEAFYKQFDIARLPDLTVEKYLLALRYLEQQMEKNND